MHQVTVTPITLEQFATMEMESYTDQDGCYTRKTPECISIIVPGQDRATHIAINL